MSTISLACEHMKWDSIIKEAASLKPRFTIVLQKNWELARDDAGTQHKISYEWSTRVTITRDFSDACCFREEFD